MPPVRKRHRFLGIASCIIIWKAVHQVRAFQPAMPIGLSSQSNSDPSRPQLSRLWNEGRLSSTRTNKSDQSRGHRIRPQRAGSVPGKNEPETVRFNKQIVGCNDAQELLGLLQTKPLGRPSCGGALSSINFSTTLHRLARHSLSRDHREPTGGRTGILSDARFALFVASLAETIVAQKVNGTSDGERQSSLSFIFESRELSNICWAIAKLQFAPPQTAMRFSEDLDSSLEALATEAREVRGKVIEAARQRLDRMDASSPSVSPAWIPSLSRLAGHVLDYIGLYVLETEQDPTSARYAGLRPFQMQEYANLLWSFATAGRAVPAVCCLILRRMLERQQSLLLSHEGGTDEALGKILQPQEWSNSIWSMATAQIDTAAETVADFLEYLSDLLKEYPHFASRFKPQEWSNTVWGVATLLSNHQKTKHEGLAEHEEAAALSVFRVAARTILTDDGDVMTRMKSQELSNTLWGLATLGFGLSMSSAQTNINNYILLRGQQPEDTRLKDAIVSGFVNRALEILPSFRSQELNNMAWALARLADGDIGQTTIPNLLERIAFELANPRRKVTSQDIGTSLWSLATLGICEPGLYRSVVARISPKLAEKAKPQELSNMVWALSTADVPLEQLDAFDSTLLPASQRPKISDPLLGFFGLVAEELMRRTDEFKAQEIKDVLWSFSRSGIRFPTLFKYVAEYLVGGVETKSRCLNGRGLDDFSTQGLSNLAWAFARQAQLSEDVLARNTMSAFASGNGRLVVYTTSYHDIGEQLLRKLFAHVASTYLSYPDGLRKLKSQDLCVTAWAFAVLGLKHTKFMTAARDEVQGRLRDFVSGKKHASILFKGQELANFCWAMGTIDIDTDGFFPSLTDYLTAAIPQTDHGSPSDNIAREFSRQELANLAWSCGVFWRFPELLMKIVYHGLVGRGNNQNPSELARAHGDGGLQPQAIMTLIYVHTAMRLAGSCKSLSLPRDFPQGWQETTPSTSFDHTTDSILELKLSTSKMQLAVSASLSRVGFNHVVEHIITMHDLVQEHGIDISDLPLEVLSIDMADVENKIAIEVDGPAHFVTEIDDTHTQGDDDIGFSKVINGKLEWQFRWNGSRQTMNGSTVLKQRLLTQLGWKVINIPFWDWYELENNEAAQDEFCRSILTSVSK